MKPQSINQSIFQSVICFLFFLQVLLHLLMPSNCLKKMMKKLLVWQKIWRQDLFPSYHVHRFLFQGMSHDVSYPIFFSDILYWIII